jgi:hypothetical protein
MKNDVHTCHYERDKDGIWWIVWSADFIGDKSGRKKCEDSGSMEIAYQQGIQDVGNYMQDRIAELYCDESLALIDLIHDLLRGRIPNENS